MVQNGFTFVSVHQGFDFMKLFRQALRRNSQDVIKNLKVTTWL